jgi:hypothetical protein
MDSGANRHATYDRDILKGFQSFSKLKEIEQEDNTALSHSDVSPCEKSCTHRSSALT